MGNSPLSGQGVSESHDRDVQGVESTDGRPNNLAEEIRDNPSNPTPSHYCSCGGSVLFLPRTRAASKRCKQRDKYQRSVIADIVQLCDCYWNEQLRIKARDTLESCCETFAKCCVLTNSAWSISLAIAL